MLESTLNFPNRDTQMLIFGKDGQVGLALQACCKEASLTSVTFLGRDDCDLSDYKALMRVLDRYQPQIIVNASGYTGVDQAEREPDLAFAVNRDAVAVMAEYMARVPNGVLVHYSTDYVYSGQQQTPYLETDDPEPLSVYGQSKLAGDDAIVQLFGRSGSGAKYFILRTSWVYGQGGNFIRTMLRLAKEKEYLRVVADQYGVPTSADWLAMLAIEFMKSNRPSGIYHAVPDGQTSWHQLALFVIELARKMGEDIKVTAENILAISSSEYPVAASRPKNSCLSNGRLKQVLFNIAVTQQFPTWQEQVTSYVEKYVGHKLKS
jgi:dTDP-4-dehydrorhamnose reductase